MSGTTRPASKGPNEVEIRPARAEDIGEALAMYEELRRLQDPWYVFALRPTIPKEAEAGYRAALGGGDAAHFVAEQEGRLVGMALARVTTPSAGSDEPAVELSHVYVRPSHRRRGIARALIAEAVSFARGRGVRRMVLKAFSQNPEAMRFWEALGFRPRYVQMTATVEDLLGPANEGR